MSMDSAVMDDGMAAGAVLRPATRAAGQMKKEECKIQNAKSGKAKVKAVECGGHPERFRGGHGRVPRGSLFGRPPQSGVAAALCHRSPRRWRAAGRAQQRGVNRLISLWYALAQLLDLRRKKSSRRPDRVPHSPGGRRRLDICCPTVLARNVCEYVFFRAPRLHVETAGAMAEGTNGNDRQQRPARSAPTPVPRGTDFT